MSVRWRWRLVSVSYTFDAATGVILITAAGEFTRDDFVAVQCAVEEDQTIPTGSAVLFDVRDVTRFAIPGHDIVAFALAKNAVDRRARRIAVVVEGPVGYSLAKMYGSARGNVNPPFRVFGAVEPAMAWLVAPQ